MCKIFSIHQTFLNEIILLKSLEASVADSDISA